MRLWPLSRVDRPKPFVPLFGGDCSFDLALEVARLPGLGRPMVIASAYSERLVREHLVRSKLQAQLFIESAPCNTALAIAIAAEAASREAPNTTLLILAADHWMENLDSFAEALEQAATAAEHGHICVFGVEPDRSETQFGYIRKGLALGSGCYRVAQFAEKPDLYTAANYVSDGWLWNAGNFMGRASIFVEELQSQAPEVLKVAREMVSAATLESASCGTVHHLGMPAFPPGHVPPSFDVAVMERTARAAVVTLESGWADLGTWEAVLARAEKDDGGSFCSGPVQALDTQSSLLWSDGPQLVALGLKDMIVAATADGVLVADRSSLGDLKPIIEQLNTKGLRSTAASSSGCGSAIVDGDRLLHQAKGTSVTLHTLQAGAPRHLAPDTAHRHLLVTKGMITVGCADSCLQLKAGDSMDLPTGQSIDMQVSDDSEALVLVTSLSG